jgi:hypothetical protein
MCELKYSHTRRCLRNQHLGGSQMTSPYGIQIVTAVPRSHGEEILRALPRLQLLRRRGLMIHDATHWHGVIGSLDLIFRIAAPLSTENELLLVDAIEGRPGQIFERPAGGYGVRVVHSLGQDTQALHLALLLYQFDRDRSARTLMQHRRPLHHRDSEAYAP